MGRQLDPLWVNLWQRPSVFWNSRTPFRTWICSGLPPALSRKILTCRRKNHGKWMKDDIKMMLKSFITRVCVSWLIWCLLILWMSWDVPFFPCLPDVVGRLSPKNALGLQPLSFSAGSNNAVRQVGFSAKLRQTLWLFSRALSLQGDIHLENLAEALQ